MLGLSDATDVPASRMRDVLHVLDPEPLLGEELLDLGLWIAKRFGCAPGEALGAILPGAARRRSQARQVAELVLGPAPTAEEQAALEKRAPKQARVLRELKALDGGPVELSELRRRTGLSATPIHAVVEKGWVLRQSVERAPDSLLAGDGVERTSPPELTQAQTAALEAITRPGPGGAFCLWGVTGSGKTEVYLGALQAAVAAGRGGIVLVPEIALTPQTVRRFRERFDGVAVLHSRLTDAERRSEWEAIRSGSKRVVVGARSAVFAPVADLGVIVVDEEHEPSFKQGSSPRYHARDVALERARRAGAACVLGSATPSLETYALAQAGDLELLRLPDRVGGGVLPTVRLVDMRSEADDRSWRILAPSVMEALAGALERGEQALLFLNRRGFAPVLYCRACGRTLRCSECDSSMTLHSRSNRLLCHLCNLDRAVPEGCPSCDHAALDRVGVGVERVEQAVRRSFPQARVARMDTDTMVGKDAHEEVLGAFGEGRLDVLVGTQMIAKGLDFPNVTLVAVVDADVALYMPDFRAAERTFQLLAQVAGRAGRSSKPGQVFIQTSAPSHPALEAARHHDYETFAAGELARRLETATPPYGRMARLVFQGKVLKAVDKRARSAATGLVQAVEEAGGRILGPAPAPFAIVRGRHRMHMLIKARPAAMDTLLPALAKESFSARGGVRAILDVDPIDLL